VNGQEGAGVPGADPGLTRGWNVFETFRSYGPTPFRLDAHLVRLRMSCEAVDIRLPQGLRQRLLERVDADSWHRITLTRGGCEVLTVAPIDAAYVGCDRRVACVPWAPMPGLPATVKHGSRIGWQASAAALGVDELLFVASDGALLEANRSNVLAVVDGVIVTPALDGRQLAGVTRQALLDAARADGLPCEEAALTSYDPFDELYLCSTLKELAPVVELDGRPAAGAGPIGARLHAAFRALVAREAQA